MKPLEALKEIRFKLSELEFVVKRNGETMPYIQEENWNIIEKALKALEIIKEKGLSINEIAFIKNRESWKVYVETMKELYWGDEHLDKVLKTKKQYDLLKKVLE